MSVWALRIVWPAFLVSIAACGLFFSQFDPVELAFVSRFQGASPLAFYTVGFLGFWFIGAASSALTVLLYRSAADVNRRRSH